MKLIETRNQREIIRMALIRIMGEVEKIGESEEEMEVWEEYDSLTEKMFKLLTDLEHTESKWNKRVDRNES